MSSRSNTPEPVEATEAAIFIPAPVAKPSLLSFADAVIAAGLLAATLAVCLPTAMGFRSDARKMDRAALASRERCERTRSQIQQVEVQHALASEQRRAVARYLAEVDSRPVTPWPAAVNELCRNRPRGLWAVQLRGSGPRFQAVVQAARPDLVAAYARKLSKSARTEFATRPGDGSGLQVVGRWRGE